ncbi:acyltransferase family protein [Tsuneonella sp. HG222]
MTDATDRQGPARLPLLDGMRGLAALYVMSYHAWLFGLAGPLMQRAYLFVDLFFVLSGFVLAKAFDSKLRSGLTPAAFMRMRVARLWPMVAAGSLLGLLLFATAGRFAEGLRWLPLSLLLIPALWLPRTLFPLNGPQWSLVLELVANLLHAVVLAKLRTAWLALAVGITGVILAICILRHGSNEFGMNGPQFLPGVARVMFGYGAGLLVARWHAGAIALRWPDLPWPAALALPVAVIAALPYAPLGHAAGDILIAIIAFPLWLILAIRAPASTSAEPWLRRLGLLSYPLYAIHLPILQIVQLHFDPSVGRIVAPVLAIALGAILAALFEARRLRHKDKQRAAVPGIAPA